MTGRVNRRGEDLLIGGARFARSPGLIARALAPGFGRILDRIEAGIARGSLTCHLPDGSTRVLGGRAPGFEAVVRLADWRALIRLVTSGSIGWYQAWEAREWDSPDLVPVFALFADNATELGNIGRARGAFRIAARMAHWFNRNSRTGALRNIHAHYDLGNDFYSAWLDLTMTYSSARFLEPPRIPSDLEGGQQFKMSAISERIMPEPGKRLLEIGCGWGSLSFAFAHQFDVDVTAISLSDAQLAWARSKFGDNPRLTYRKQDYRDVHGQYDGIYSVEMVEALGRQYWPTFMDCIARNLKPGGRAAIQFISMRDDLFDAYAASADFIQAYIFPGGLLIRTSEFRRLAEERGMRWRDQDDFGLDYAETLRLWRENFDLAVSTGRLPAGFDERFIRLWRFYLMYCEGGFRGGLIDVHQVTLIRN